MVNDTASTGGSVRQPTLLSRQEVMFARPVVGEGEPPEPGAGSGLSVFLETESVDAPGISVVDSMPLAAVGARQRWQLTLQGEQGDLQHGLTAVEQGLPPYEELVHFVADAPLPAAHRPSWSDQLFLPKVLPGPAKSLRREMAWLLRASSLLRTLSLRIDWPEIIVDAYPWRTVGKVRTGTAPDFENGEKASSGVLVGPNILLTASHIKRWDDPSQWIRFEPAYFDGPSQYGRAYAEQVYGYPHTSGEASEWDLMVCKLNRRLGDEIGWMGTYGTTDQDYYLHHDAWLSVGYPEFFYNAQRPLTEYFVDIIDVDSDGDAFELEAREFTGGGWSGGPLFGWMDDGPRVIGIASGIEQDSLDDWLAGRKNSVFAGGLPLVNLVKYAWANWV